MFVPYNKIKTSIRTGGDMDKIQGNIDTLSSMQLTAAMEGLDAECKLLLSNREILAVILKETVDEYKEYSREEIIGFIEPDSIESDREVSPGRTNSQVQGAAQEFAVLNEKVSKFDIRLKAKNPKLSKEKIVIKLHIDVEPQKTYRPGYPIEKRGMYYLSRELSSQLSLVTDSTDYGELEKCYSIWICLDDIPQDEQNSVSFYEMTNTKNIGNCITKKEDYDLLTLVVIRLGKKEYNGEKKDEGYDLLRFLNTIMYPHRDDFMEVVSDYIDFSQNSELREEVKKVMGIGQIMLETGIEQGIEVFILDNEEEGIPRERVIEKLQKRFKLTEDRAVYYYDRFASRDKLTL